MILFFQVISIELDCCPKYYGTGSKYDWKNYQHESVNVKWWTLILANWLLKPWSVSVTQVWFILSYPFNSKDKGIFNSSKLKNRYSSSQFKCEIDILRTSIKARHMLIQVTIAVVPDWGLGFVSTAEFRVLIVASARITSKPSRPGTTSGDTKKLSWKHL